MIFASLFKKKKNQINGHMVDRDLSWLKFNKRVLEEARNKNNPLLERVKFLSISGSNLDEFLMVRLAGLNRIQLNNLPINSLSNLGNDEIMNSILIELKKIHKEQNEIWEILIKELKVKRYFVVQKNDLRKKDRICS